MNQWETETSNFSNLNHPDMCCLTLIEAKGGIFDTPLHNNTKGHPKEASSHLFSPFHTELSFFCCVVSCEKKKDILPWEEALSKKKRKR
jgi:hypothetical protein